MAYPDFELFSPRSNEKTMTYLTLGFDSTEIGPDGGQLLTISDRLTQDSGQSPDRPFEIGAGIYYLTVRVSYGEPTEVINVEGEIEYRYETEMWHIETEGNVVTPAQTTRTIVVICKPQDSIGEQLTYVVKPTNDNLLPLGNIVLTNSGDYELMLVGDVHLCFWDEYGVMFKRLPRNLKYYIRVI